MVGEGNEGRTNGQYNDQHYLHPIRSCQRGKLLSNRTGIVIAHRLATIRHADEILILKDGFLQEYGLREQLESNSTSHFYRLLQTGLEAVLA